MFKANSMINVNHFRKVVIVIGNGFDLDLNLKTSYKNFMTSKTFKDYRKDSHSLPIDSYSRLNLFDFLKERFDGNDKRWIDIEIELRDFAKNIDLSDFDNEIEAINYIKTSFNQLQLALCDYLSEIDYTILNSESVAIELLKAISRGMNCVLYSFNYTDIGRLLTYIGGTPLFAIHYVHGTLKDKNIVVGVENIRLQYSDLDFMVKFKSDSYKTSDDFDLRKDLEAAEEVLIFGHTLGCTDHSYFKQFFQDEINKVNNRRTPISIVTFDANSRRSILREIDEMTNYNADMLNINFIHTHGNTSTEDTSLFFKSLAKRIRPNIVASILR